jgi:hypothetical protein
MARAHELLRARPSDWFSYGKPAVAPAGNGTERKSALKCQEYWATCRPIISGVCCNVAGTDRPCQASAMSPGDATTAIPLERSRDKLDANKT